MTRNSLFLGLIALIVSACATTPSDTVARLEAADKVFGGAYKYLIVEPGRSWQDQVFVTWNNATGPSTMSRQLATLVAPGELEPTRILVSGASDEKTLQVIEDAFEFHSGQLPHLEFLFLGPTEQEPKVRELVEAHGGKLYFSPY